MARVSRRPLGPLGFTLLELLVVLAIIALLVALLPAALRSSWDSSHRAECANNLKLLIGGAQRYAVHRVTFPWGEGPIDWNGWGAIALTLPFLDQAPLHNQINFLLKGDSPSGVRLPDPYLSPYTPMQS